jgi:hypothetical protein
VIERDGPVLDGPILLKFSLLSGQMRMVGGVVFHALNREHSEGQILGDPSLLPLQAPSARRIGAEKPAVA